MKKLSLIFVGIGILTLITGCQYFQGNKSATPESEEDTAKEFKLEKKTGVLTPLAEEELLKATHSLKTESNEVISVRSGIVNLRKYENRLLEVEGRFTELDGIFEIETVTKLGQEDSLRELYQNPLLGFRLTYPSTWEVIEKTDGVLFTPYPASEDELVDRISVTKLSNEKKLAVKEWLDLETTEEGQMKSSDLGDDSFYTEAVIGPDQISGIKRTSRDLRRIDFYMVRENSAIRLTHTSIEDEEEEKYRNVFLEMINSFQFVPYGESVSTSTPVAESSPAISKTPSSSSLAPADSSSASSAPAEVTAEAKPAEGTPTEGLSYIPPENVTQILQSRGFAINMKYPKGWYWAQSGSELHFSNKSLEDSAAPLIKLKRSTENETGECKKLDSSYYCFFFTNPGDYAKLEDAVAAMLESISPITEP